MISRYALYDTAQLSTYFNLPGLPKGVKPHYAIASAMNAPVVISENGSHVAKLMKWGLIPSGAKDVNSIFRYKTHNIASEKIFSRHSWQQAVRQRRCLIPANGFYELDEKNNRAYYVRTTDAALSSFAGVYSEWNDPDGVVYGTYSLVTIEAEAAMPASSERIPIIISRQDEARWLDPTISDLSSLYDMLRHYPVDKLAGYEVGVDVFSSKNDSPHFIDRV
jgi:putative SOS response-associated peptidase YedK